MDRYSKLYSKKVYVHHYTQFLDESIFKESAEVLSSLYGDYKNLINYSGSEVVNRYKPLF